MHTKMYLNIYEFIHKIIKLKNANTLNYLKTIKYA